MHVNVTFNGNGIGICLRRCVRMLCMAICIVAGLAGPAQAQRLDPSKALTQYTLDIWTKENGLPQNAVNAICQSRAGYLWVGTYQGLARFDGLEFRTYSIGNSPGLASNGIFALMEDRNGALWVGTNGGGVSVFKDDVFTNYTTKEGLPHNNVISLLEDSKGRVWVGTSTGVVVYENGKFTSFDKLQALSRNSILSITEDREGRIWFGTRGNVFTYYEGQMQKETTAPFAPQNFTSLLVDQNGVLWIGSDAGLFVRKNGITTRIDRKDGLQDEKITRMFEDKNGVVWIGTLSGGLHRYWRGRIDVLNSRNGLADDRIQSLLEDREGNLWIGTGLNGLHRLKEGKFVNYGPPEGMSAEIAYCVLRGTDDAMYVGTFSGGVNRLQNGQFTHITTAQGLGNNYVRCMYQDPERNLWVGIYGVGLQKISNGRVVATYGRAQGLVGTYIRAMVPDGAGGLWLATQNGLSHFTGGSFVNYTTENGLSINSILCMAQDPFGNLWLGTDGGGLMRLTDGKFVYYTAANGLTNDVVMSLYFDEFEKCLWVGTNLGLDRVQIERGTEKIFNFKNVEGIYGESVFQVLDDKRGSLWMGTNNGIYRVLKNDLNSFMKGMVARVTTQHFDHSDGMRTGQTTPNGHPSGVRDDLGRLWFPTPKGVTVIDPARIIVNELAPPVAIESIVADGQSVKVDDVVELGPGNEKYEIKYAGLSLMATEKVQMQYMLEGFEKDWVNVGRRNTAYYTSLPPGSYVFRVKACNNDGVWNETGASVKIVLRPYFYQTWWFALLVLAAFLAMGYVLLRWRERRVRLENRWLEAKVAMRTMEVTQQKEAIAKHNELLNLKNTDLEQKTNQLESALNDLRTTQDLLIQSEKMAALGQLMANISHEINTPIAAVTTTARSSARMLPNLLHQLPEKLRLLNESELEAFRAMVDRALNANNRYTTKEERELRRGLEEVLRGKGIKAADELAGKLSIMRINDNVEAYLPLLKRADSVELLSLAGELVQVNQNIDLIKLAADKTTRIVSALKTYSHISSNQQKTPTDLFDNVEMVLTLYDNQFKHGIDVTVDGDKLPPIPVYPDEIEQVWINIIHNSILAMEGKGKLEIYFGLKTTTQRQEAFVRFTDSGKGISADVLPRIFDPFFTTRPKGQGSGLGLHICKTIIDKHKGRIEVQSEPGRTTFEVYLPLAG
jgi:ligand-binding sensor domain-containing protein/signal transduction histidine kinase